MKHKEKINFKGLEIELFQLYELEESINFMHQIINEVDLSNDEVIIFGKRRIVNRKTAFYGDDNISYRYSGVTKKANRWSKTLKKILSDVSVFGTYNACLINYYPTGNEGMGWHSDNEDELGENPTILSLSFGATRSFQLREKSTKKNKFQFELKSGSCLIMKGMSQKLWEHSLPKDSKCSSQRLNLTYRLIQ